MMMNANLIRGKIIGAGLTQAKTAELVGISSNSLSRKLTGQREFRLSEVCSLCNVLDITDPTPYFFTSKIPNTQQEGCVI